MNKTIFAVLPILMLTAGFSQELKYSVRTTQTKQVKQENLVSANSLSDVYPGYPASWISDYISTEIKTTHKGKSVVASGTNEQLSSGQKKILQSLDPGAAISITVKYLNLNPVTNLQQENKLQFEVGLQLHSQAEFTGGSEGLNRYLSEIPINRIPVSETKSFKGALIRFMVNEEGRITQAKVTQSSGNPDTDALLLKAINKMPRWKPAMDAKGKKVAQQFEFSVGADGC